jgi:hypothetical protein
LKDRRWRLCWLFDYQNNVYFMAASNQKIKGTRFEYLKRTSEQENLISIVR